MSAILVRCIVMYIVIMISMRIMGKRQIGELQAGELVVTVLISELVAIPIQDINQPIINGIIAVLTLVLLEITFSLISLKSPFIRTAISGKSMIVISDGKIDQSAMKKLRMSVDDLTESLRLQSVFEIDTVQYAIIETNGKMSILLKPPYRTPTADLFKFKIPDNGLPSSVISDGKTQKDSLNIVGMTPEKLKKVLNSKKIKACDVFHMTADKNGDYIINMKDDSK